MSCVPVAESPTCVRGISWNIFTYLLAAWETTSCSFLIGTLGGNNGTTWTLISIMQGIFFWTPLQTYSTEDVESSTCSHHNHYRNHRLCHCLDFYHQDTTTTTTAPPLMPPFPDSCNCWIAAAATTHYFALRRTCAPSTSQDRSYRQVFTENYRVLFQKSRYLQGRGSGFRV